MFKKIIKKIQRLHWILYRKKLFFYMAYQKNWMLDPSTNKRSKYWRKCGAHINGNINIGYDVYFDASNASFITIDKGAWIAARCIILCHQRDLSNYFYGDDINLQPHLKKEVHICEGAHIGMGTTIMPGVTIGKGAIIGAGALVTHDIPDWSIAVGVPAKVIKTISKK